MSTCVTFFPAWFIFLLRSRNATLQASGLFSRVGVGEKKRSIKATIGLNVHLFFFSQVLGRRSRYSSFNQGREQQKC